MAHSAAEVAGALTSHTLELTADIYELIVGEIPQLRADRRVLTLLQASVEENVATLLHVLEHGIDMSNVRIPSAAEEYARRLAQRGIPIAALLRAYRIGSARFQDWCLQELGQRTDNAALVSAAGLRIAETTALYIDQVSEEVVAAYEAEKENWLRNRSAARVRALLRGERVEVDASEAILGYRLRQRHVGVVCWVAEAEAGSGTLAQLEQPTVEVARRAECDGRPLFLPQDESSAWAWFPLGARDSFAVPAARAGAAREEPRIRSTRPRRASVVPPSRTACTLNWPGWQANGSVRPSCGTWESPGHKRPGIPGGGGCHEPCVQSSAQRQRPRRPGRPPSRRGRDDLPGARPR